MLVCATTMPRSECPFTWAVFQCLVPSLYSYHYFISSMVVLFQFSFVDSPNSLGAKIQAKPVARCCPKAKELCKPRSQHRNSALCKMLNRSAVTSAALSSLFVSSNGTPHILSKHCVAELRPQPTFPVSFDLLAFLTLFLFILCQSC